MRTTIAEYVSQIHAACDQHERESRTAAQRRLREREREQLALAKAARSRRRRPLSARHTADSVDRLRSRGLLPMMRAVPNAKPLPPVGEMTLPAWMTTARDSRGRAMRCDDPALAWLLMDGTPTDPASVLAMVNRAAREERCGRVSRRIARACTITHESDEIFSEREYRAARRAYGAAQAESDRAAGLIDLASALPPSALDILSQGGTLTQAAVAAGVSASYLCRLVRRVRAAARLCRLAWVPISV